MYCTVTRDDQGKTVNPHVGPLAKITSLKLFFDIEPSFSADITRALPGCFRGGSAYMSFRFKAKENLPHCGYALFVILITSKRTSALGMFGNFNSSLNKRWMSPAQTITTEH